MQDVPAAMDRDATSNCTGLSSTGMGGNGGRMGDTTSFMILLLDTMVLPYPSGGEAPTIAGSGWFRIAPRMVFSAVTDPINFPVDG